MTVTWQSPTPPPEITLSARDRIRALRRGAAVVALIAGGVVISLPLRLIERPVFGLHRPWSPHVTQWVSRAVFALLGMRHETQGRPMTGPGAVVANHVSWLDIFALNARKRVYFVSKSEVAHWPGIGALARLTGTVFIARDPRQARAQTEIFQTRLHAGHRLLFFPEGSSTDGLRVLPFKPTLFQSFFAPGLRDATEIQPVSVIYSAPPGQDSRFYGWWGDMGFGPHLLQVLGARHQGRVRIIYHPPRRVSEFENRKALAAWAETCVRSGLPERHMPG